MLDGQLNPWMIAQEAPALPLEGGGAPAGTGTGAAGTPGAGGPPGNPFGEPMMLIIFAMVGLLIVMSIVGQRRDRKKREKMLSSIKKHDRVQTIGGVIGSVVDVKTHEVVLKVDESSNTRITFARSAIQQILSGDADAAPAATSESLN